MGQFHYLTDNQRVDALLHKLRENRQRSLHDHHDHHDHHAQPEKDRFTNPPGMIAKGETEGVQPSPHQDTLDDNTAQTDIREEGIQNPHEAPRQMEDGKEFSGDEMTRSEEVELPTGDAADEGKQREEAAGSTPEQAEEIEAGNTEPKVSQLPEFPVMEPGGDLHIQFQEIADTLLEATIVQSAFVADASGLVMTETTASDSIVARSSIAWNLVEDVDRSQVVTTMEPDNNIAYLFLVHALAGPVTVGAVTSVYWDDGELRELQRRLEQTLGVDI